MNEELNAVLNLLAERFGTTVEQLYQVMLVQAKISFATQSLVWIIVGVLCYMFVTKWHNILMAKYKEADGDEGEIAPAMMMMIGWLATGIAGVSFAFSINGLVTMLLNPNYWVLQQILSLVSGGG